MSKWEEKRIVDICSRVVSGGTPLKSKSEYYQNGEIPWLKTGEVKKSYIYETEEKITQQGLSNSSAKIVPKDSIIIAMYGDGNTAGSVAITKIDLTTNQACCNLILNKKVAFYGFVYFYLKGNYNNLVNLKSGGSQQNLNAQTIKNFNIIIPPLPIQKKIAAIASAYDDLIENNDRRITLLEKMAEEIYREWFVRLRFPGHEQATFHKGIPEGWEVKELEEFCKRVTDGTHDTPKPTNEGYFLVTGKNIKNGTVDFENAYKISKKDHINISKRSGLESGDIIFSNIGTLGSIAIVTDDIEYSVKNVLIFKPVDKNQSVFLYYMLKEKYVLENLLLHSSGASQQFIGLTVARKFKVFDPGKLLINNFGEFVLPLQQKRLLLIRANSKLKQTRDRLLIRLISGKLSVEDLDIQFPPSMLENFDKNEKALETLS